MASFDTISQKDLRADGKVKAPYELSGEPPNNFWTRFVSVMLVGNFLLIFKSIFFGAEADTKSAQAKYSNGADVDNGEKSVAPNEKYTGPQLVHDADSGRDGGLPRQPIGSSYTPKEQPSWLSLDEPLFISLDYQALHVTSPISTKGLVLPFSQTNADAASAWLGGGASGQASGKANGENPTAPGLVTAFSIPPKSEEQVGNSDQLEPGEVGEDDGEDTASGPDGKIIPNRLPVTNSRPHLGGFYVNQSVAISLTQLLDGTVDHDSDPLSIGSLSASTGQVHAVSDVAWRFTPEPFSLDTVTFSYEISDGTGVIQQTAFVDYLPLPGATITGTQEADLIVGTPGADTINAQGGNDSIVSREDDDVIRGGDGDDRILAGDGDDVIHGEAGEDIIFAGAGDDWVSGGTGDDIIHGEEGNDQLYGDDGSDIILAGAGDDYVEGGSGDDKLSGDAGEDLIAGGTGNDEISGGDGNDTLLGEDGDDMITGGAGLDVAYGGAGNDIIFGDAGNDTLSGGIGDDEIVGGTGNDRLVGDEGNDSLSGDEGNDILLGGGGNDEVHGGTGNDILFGNDGDDQLTPGGGDDIVDGGTGGDTYDTSSTTQGVRIDLGAGQARGSEIGDDQLSNIENAVGGSGEDEITGSDADNVLSGGSGNDYVSGGNGRDTFWVYRLSQNENDGDDRYDGGNDRDTYDASNTVLGVHVDLAAGTAYGPEIGRDVVSRVEDVIGGSGNDTLVANDEANIFTGGAGNDSFVFYEVNKSGGGSNGRARDRIEDFEVGDQIDLTSLDGDENTAGFQRLTFDFGKAEFDGVAQAISRYETDSEGNVTTILSVNRDDDIHDAEFEIEIVGKFELTSEHVLT